MTYQQKYAEGSTLIRVPVSVRDKLITLRRRLGKDTWSPLESLGQVVARLAPAEAPKKPAGKRGRKVNNKARRPGRRHR